MPSRRSHRSFQMALAAAAIAVLAACGGGSNESPDPAPASASATPTTRVFVAGDSLADSGTFGFKATVQNAADPAAGYLVYSEIVARNFGIPLCNVFASADEGATFTTTGGSCTNYAVAGAMIVNPVTRDGNDSPFSLQNQLEAAVTGQGNRWQPGDLIVVDAGGNDSAALASVYLDAHFGGSSEEAVYTAFLAQQLSAGDISGSNHEEAAALYMRELARTYWGLVKGNLVDRGATKVALLDVPDLTLTPRIRQRIADIAATQGTAEAEAFRTNLQQWIAGFNAELQALAAAEPRVAYTPYNAEFTAQLASPAANGLTNVVDAPCAVYPDFPQCTDAALDAAPPAGQAAGWWRTYYFSDEFHPSPRGHQLLARTVLDAIQRMGWR